MPFRLTRVPLVRKEQIVSLSDVPITLRTYQPVVWVRLVPWAGSVHPDAITFPAVVDTGNNHSFLIAASLFRAWVRLDPSTLRTKHKLLVNAIELACHGLNIDVYRMRGDQPSARIAGR